MIWKVQNGTQIDGKKLETAKYYEIKHGDIIKFGLSEREYLIQNESIA